LSRIVAVAAGFRADELASVSGEKLYFEQQK
jgi:hypothetical protein